MQGGPSTAPDLAAAPCSSAAPNSGLQAVGLAAFRAERLVFSDVDFAVLSGGALQVLGPNGAGKSSLLRVLAGLLRPAAGTLLWQDLETLGDRVQHSRRVAYLGHQDAVKPALSVAGNLRLAGGDALAALAAVGLATLADLPARLLSAGQRRRLAIARLTLAPGPVWLLDEPTLGLDDASVDRLGAIVARHRAAGGMVIAATHLALPLPGAATLRLGG